MLRPSRGAGMLRLRSPSASEMLAMHRDICCFGTVAESSVEKRKVKQPTNTGVKSWWHLTEYLKTMERNTSKNHFKTIVVGGGSAGLAVASHLRYYLGEQGLCVIDAAKYHYYQPAWTFVGAGMDTLENTRKKMSYMMPKDVAHFRSAVAEFVPNSSEVILDDGTKLGYDYLVVATGIVPAWDEVKGLKEALGRDGVTTNYLSDYCTLTSRFIRGTTKGNALFTMPPNGRIKCPGAPQKIMYLADEIWREETRVRQNINMKFFTGNPTQFAIQPYADRLNEICDQKGIERTYSANLVALDGDKRVATFSVIDGPNKGQKIEQSYSFIHVAPPMYPPEVVRKSELANAGGFVDVDKHSLISKKFPNVFALGDCSSVPTSKTSAAAGMEARAVCQNIINLSSGQSLHGYYNGYASCPVIVNKKQVIMAEFNAFTGELMPTFPIDQTRPSRLMMYVKKYVIPFIYWKLLMRGIWPGNAFFRDFFGFFKPEVQEPVPGHKSMGRGA